MNLQNKIIWSVKSWNKWQTHACKFIYSVRLIVSWNSWTFIILFCVRLVRWKHNHLNSTNLIWKY
jgi:hypothetical protein